MDAAYRLPQSGSSGIVAGVLRSTREDPDYRFGVRLPAADEQRVATHCAPARMGTTRRTGGPKIASVHLFRSSPDQNWESGPRALVRPERRTMGFRISDQG